MTSPWWSRSSVCFVAAASLTLQTASASAHSSCVDDAATGWLPQRSWPAACEPDAATDGLVMLEGDALADGAPGGEGQLQIVVQRMVSGAAVETFAGKVSRVDATAALFQSERALAPAADYQITAERVDLDGTALGNKFTSAFHTGMRALPPLTFASAPTLGYEEADTERFECMVDECGAKHCEPSDEMVHLKSVRIAVPPITGGVELRPYSVSAKLVASFSNGQAPAVATSDTAATQAGKRSFLVVELPALPSGATGCVTISATDVAGHTVASEPVCTPLPADEQPYDKEVSAPKFDSQVAYAQTTEASTSEGDKSQTQPTVDAPSSEETMQASTQGCSVGHAPGKAFSSAWLALAVMLARLRARKPRPSARSQA